MNSHVTERDKLRDLDLDGNTKMNLRKKLIVRYRYGLWLSLTK